MRKCVIKIYAYILAIGLAYFAVIKLTGRSLPCFYLKTTGLLCPGCGITNLFLSLAGLDFSGAFSSNPVVFLLLIVWNFVGVMQIIGGIKFLSNKNFLYFLLYFSIFLLVIFGIVRNFI